MWGWLTFTNAADLGGTVAWIKPALGSGEDRGGFSLTAAAFGARYLPPGRGTNVLGLTVNTNLTLMLTPGGLEMADQFALEANGHVTTLSGPKLSLTFTTATGAFNGSMRIPGTSKSVSFGGVLLQDRLAGFGFFMGGHGSGEVLVVNQNLP